MRGLHRNTDRKRYHDRHANAYRDAHKYEYADVHTDEHGNSHIRGADQHGNGDRDPDDDSNCLSDRHPRPIGTAHAHTDTITSNDDTY